MTKETQQDYINPLSVLIDDIIEYVELTPLVQELEEAYPEMLTELAAAKKKLSQKEYCRHIVMWILEKGRFFEDVLHSYEGENFLDNVPFGDPDAYPAMGNFEYWDYGSDSCRTVVFVFEYGQKYIYLCYNEGYLGEKYSGRSAVVDSLEEIEDIFTSLASSYSDMCDFGLTEFGSVSAYYWIKGKEIYGADDGNPESDDYLKIESDFVFKVTEEKPIEDVIIHGFEYLSTSVKGDIKSIQHGKEQGIEEETIEEMSEQLLSSSELAKLKGITVDHSKKSLTITITLFSSMILKEQVSDKMDLTLSINGEKKVLSNVTE